MSKKYAAKFSSMKQEEKRKSLVGVESSHHTVEFTALDTEYVKEHLGRPLTLGLAQICLKKPRDPIEFLAHWLYKYRENELADVERQRDDQMRELDAVVLQGEEIGTI